MRVCSTNYSEVECRFEVSNPHLFLAIPRICAAVTASIDLQTTHAVQLYQNVMSPRYAPATLATVQAILSSRTEVLVETDSTVHQANVHHGTSSAVNVDL